MSNREKHKKLGTEFQIVRLINIDTPKWWAVYYWDTHETQGWEMRDKWPAAFKAHNVTPVVNEYYIAVLPNAENDYGILAIAPISQDRAYKLGRAILDESKRLLAENLTFEDSELFQSIIHEFWPAPAPAPAKEPRKTIVFPGEPGELEAAIDGFVEMLFETQESNLSADMKAWVIAEIKSEMHSQVQSICRRIQEGEDK